MKKDLRNIILIFVVFVLIFTAGVVGSGYYEKNRQNPIDTNHVVSVIENEIGFADENYQIITKNFAHDNYGDSIVFNGYTDLYRKHRAGIFIYDKNELRNWSTNRIPAYLSSDSLKAGNYTMRLNDGWYFSIVRKNETFTYAFLFLLRHEYSYRNEYFDDAYNQLLKLDRNVELSEDPVPGATIISIDGNPVFSLKYKEIPDSYYKYGIIIPGLFLLSFAIFAVLLIWLARFLLKQNIHALIVLFALAIDIILLRFVMLYYHFPSAIYQLHVFSPEFYAESFWLPSLGDLALNIFLLCVWVLFFVRYFSLKTIVDTSIKPAFKFVFSISLSVVVFVVHLMVSSRINNLILNSSVEINLENILKFNSVSVLTLAIILLLIFNWILIFDKITRECRSLINAKIFIVCLPVIALIWYLFSGASFLMLLLPFIFILIVITIVLIRVKYNAYSWYSYVLLLIGISLYTSEHISQITEVKEIESRKVLANNLANERDVGAEFFLTLIDSQIKHDSVLAKMVLTQNSDSILQYFQRNYIKGYLNKYEFQITLCNYTDSIFVQPDNKLCNCFSFFGQLLSENGIPIPGTDFFYLDNHNGRISYFGYRPYFKSDNTEIQLFIELDSKVFSEGLGYPELLLDKKYAIKKTLKEYSYAKYNGGKLILKKGNFEYPLNTSTRTDSIDYRLSEDNGYSHLYYYPDDDNVIVLSIPETGFRGHLVSFSYLFFVLFVLFSLSRFVINIRSKQYKGVNSLKNRIQFSIVFIILLSIIVIGGISVYFIVQGYSEKHNQMLRDKMQSVEIEMEHKIGEEQAIDTTMSEYISSLLVKFSNVFYTDIHLFGTDGKLIASSRMELFEKGLQGEFMHPKALRQLRRSGSGIVIINERIGTINYLSAYVPFYNSKKELIAYINLPYFSRQDELNNEISGFIVAFTNIFLVLIILSVVVGLIIANQLTKPLAFLQERIKTIDLETKAEKIEYLRKDELGSLIREYNKKVDELAESAGKLAKSERESAWREMAKQIAHEIKNPLTPMKLSIQYLEHTYKYNDKDWEQTLKKVSRTIIEQIDTLSAIATEFSNFAQMPQAQKQRVNLIDKIRSSIILFQQSDKNVEIRTELKVENDAYIEVDPEQLTRVFNNLIKNSIQSIPDERKGLIVLELADEVNSYLFTISDNGAGIDNEMITKIFQPSFTTKSSGMGLGLSMVKNIIDQMDGEIWFETEKGRGTSFYIRFKKGV